MKKKLLRLTSATLALAMVLSIGSTGIAYAAEESANSSGSLTESIAELLEAVAEDENSSEEAAEDDSNGEASEEAEPEEGASDAEAAEEAAEESAEEAEETEAEEEVVAEALETEEETTDLAAVIEQAEALVETDYKTSTWSAFETSLEDAQTVAANADATQEEVDAAAATLTAAIDALEAMPAIDYTQYAKGVTVIESADSPTGYLAVFVYEEEDSYDGITGDITKVELYSDCMMLFDTNDGVSGSISATYAIDPWNYTAGLASAGGSSDVAYYVTMVEFADGLWGTQIPLASGAYVYNFTVYDADGNSKSRLDDPNNPTMTNTATGISSLSSMVYVDYNADTMGTGDYADRTIENPRTDGQTGTVVTTSYTGADGTEHGLAIYLPYGYDADQAEAYNVLYLSHGTSGDIYGDELRWMNEGAVANIMDNLIAEGTIEPFVVVTMNNQQYGQGDGHSGANWKYSDIEEDQQLIMEFVEANYNVSTEASGRAYAGLSMGGSTTSNMLMYHADWFSYYGIWSYANTDGSYGGVEGIDSEEIQSYLSDYVGSVNLMLAAGKWDFGNSVVNAFGSTLTELGFDYDYLEVPTAHDWEGWQLMFAYAAENFFFQNEEETVDTSALDEAIATAEALTETDYKTSTWSVLEDALEAAETVLADADATQEEVDAAAATLTAAIDALEAMPAIDYTQYAKGVTVIESADSPTGYLAVFVYEEEDSYDGITGDITKVELYSDCMMLFDTNDGVSGSISATYAIDPWNYTAGLASAGGSSDVAYYVTMVEFADGLWGTQIPLASGAYVYNFTVYDADGNSKSRLDDPNNPTMTNTATGISSLSSMVYVDYNADTMGTGDYADRTIENPRTDGQTGTVEFISYDSDQNGSNRGLAVYLPYGYDADRTEAYNVLYLSHGASGDSVGNELRWMNEGAVANIMDNLIAEGKIEPFIVVTMNNQDLGWDYSKIEYEQYNYIMPIIESSYNVSTEASGRAYAGLSMGGITTSNMLLNHAEDYAYYGIWSASNTSISDEQAATLTSLSDQLNFLMAAGQWDFGLSSVTTFGNALGDLGFTYDTLTVPGAHDWETWQLIYAYAAENFFFQNEEETVDTSTLSAAITQAEALTESDYTSSSWADLETALENAKTVLADSAATQDEVDSATAALTAAIDALEEEVTVPNATKITSLTNTAKGVKVVWSKVSNATSYQVYRKIGSGSWKKVKTTSSTSWTDTSAKKNGTKYQYKVYAVNEAGKSKASATKTIYRLTAKKFTRAKNVSSKKISLKWTRNTKATGYIIEYSTSSDFSGAKTVTVKGNKNVTTTLKNLTKGKKYYIRMRPYKTSGSVTSYAGWSKVKKVKVTK